MKKLSLIASLTLITYNLSAMEFKTVGTEMTSMGGAGIASHTNSYSVFNNPAALSKSKLDTEMSLNVGLGLQDNKLGSSISELEDSGFTNKLENFDPATATPADVAILTQGKNIVLNMNNNSLNISPEASLGFQIKNIGFGVNGYGDINAKAIVSENHNKLIIEDPNAPGTYYDIENSSASTLTDYQNTSMEYAINNGLTYVSVNGLAIAEVPVGYGHMLQTPIGKLSIGGSLKYMYGITYNQDIKVDNTDVTGNLSQKETKSSTFGVDSGMIFEPSILPSSRIALVAKNLNSPEFDTWNGEKIKVDPQIRAGIAYDILDSLEIVADIDITENDTLVNSLKSKMFGGGIAYRPASWFSLRGGLKQNISSTSDSSLVYTAGVSLGLKWFQFDIAGQYSSNSNKIQETSIPEEAKVSFALVSKW